MQNVYCTDRYNIPNQWHSYWLYPKHSHYSILIGVCVCIEHDPFVKRLCKNRQTEDYCDTSDSVLLGKLMTWKHLLEFANCISNCCKKQYCRNYSSYPTNYFKFYKCWLSCSFICLVIVHKKHDEKYSKCCVKEEQTTDE